MQFNHSMSQIVANKESVLCLTHVRNLHIYKLKSNLNCSNIVKLFSVAMCNYLTKSTLPLNQQQKSENKSENRHSTLLWSNISLWINLFYLWYLGSDFTSPFLSCVQELLKSSLHSKAVLTSYINTSTVHTHSLTSFRCGCLVRKILSDTYGSVSLRF